MMIAIWVGVWILLCIGIGYLSRKRRFGFYGGFLCAMLLTPPIMLLLILMTAPKSIKDEVV